MNAPDISFVIPCFNAAAWVAEAIESALAQEGFEKEVIVVDDGSTDESRKKLSAFGGTIRADFRPHGGASAARNRGTELAAGRFIQYLDSDDRLRPGAAKKRIDALETSGADVAYSDWQLLESYNGLGYEPGAVIRKKIEDVHTDPEIAVFTDFWAPPGAILYRRSLVDRIGDWNESLAVIQDARFLLDAALCGGRFVHVDGIGMDYRVRGTGLSRLDSRALTRECFVNAVQVRRIWEERGALDGERRRALLRVLGQTARASYGKDADTFESAYRMMNEIKPGHVPQGSKPFRALSLLVGYRTAEWIASRYRTWSEPLG